MDYLKVVGFIFLVVIAIGVIFIILPSTLIGCISKRYPRIGQHFENYKGNYKRIFITVLVLLFFYWYFSQSDDGRRCISQDHYGCLEWEYE